MNENFLVAFLSGCLVGFIGTCLLLGNIIKTTINEFRKQQRISEAEKFNDYNDELEDWQKDADWWKK